jgi:SAM-dependent methyltransferase
MNKILNYRKHSKEAVVSDVVGCPEVVEAESHEREFHNDEYRHYLLGDEKKLLVSNYLLNRLLHPDARKVYHLEYVFYLMGPLSNKICCDFGCGAGFLSAYMAKAGAIVYSFDISDIAVEVTKKVAKTNNIQESINAEVKNAYHTGYPADFFDIVFVAGVIHHLNLADVLLEIKRILKRGGKMVFLEPVYGGKFIDWLKHNTPLRKYLTWKKLTDFEKQLDENDIEQIRKILPKVSIDKFRLIARFEGKCGNDFRRVYNLFLADYYLFMIAPFVKKFASSIAGCYTKE